MEREIIFRGKRTDNGEWIDGALICLDDGETRIVTSCLSGDVPNLFNVCAYEVDPETVGQYIGLTDKNGARIFEGDIITARYVNDGRLTKGVVNFLNGCFCVKYDNYNNPAIDMLNEYEIYGKIFDKEDESND